MTARQPVAVAMPSDRKSFTSRKPAPARRSGFLLTIREAIPDFATHQEGPRIGRLRAGLRCRAHIRTALKDFRVPDRPPARPLQPNLREQKKSHRLSRHLRAAARVRHLNSGNGRQIPNVTSSPKQVGSFRASGTGSRSSPSKKHLTSLSIWN